MLIRSDNCQFEQGSYEKNIVGHVTTQQFFVYKEL